MNVIAPFGIVTACHAGDYFMAKATCASIRHFMPDVPICVIVDGDFGIGELKAVYGVHSLPVASCAHPDLPGLISGSTRSKLAAMWDGPFERFVWMDSDALAWGDIRPALDWNDTDFFILRAPQPPFAAAAVDHFFFNLEQLAVFDPGFDWRNRPYFCAGVWAGRRGCLDMEAYLELEAEAAKRPALFQFWDQGLFNYMIFKAMDAGTLRVRVLDLQYIVVDHGMGAARARFALAGWELPSPEGGPALIHFCGDKPLMQYPRAWAKPFTIFRLAHYRKIFGPGWASEIRAWLQVLSEEATVGWRRLRRKIATRLQSKSSTDHGRGKS